MPVITLFEHQEISYNELGLISDHPIVKGIEQINEISNNEILILKREGIKATQYVGVLQIGDITIQVLPKIDYAQTGNPDAVLDSDARRIASESATRNLLHLLSYTHKLQIKEQAVADLSFQKSNWLELLTRLFATNLHNLMQRGLEHNYVIIEETLPVMRGRWNIGHQLKQRPYIRHKFDVIHDEFSPNTAMNLVFKFVIEKLLITTQDAGNRMLLMDLREWMSDVELLGNVTKSHLDQVIFTRLNDRYKPAFNLARLFLEHSTLQLKSGQRQMFAFVFDMNLLFEEFVANFLVQNRIKIFPSTWQNVYIDVQSKRKSLYLVQRIPNNEKVFRLKPDVVFLNGAGSPLLVLDTKYKHITPDERKIGVGESDLYQMLAYSVRFSCPHSILVYPQPANKTAIRAQFESISDKRHFHIATINLHQPIEKPTIVIQEFAEIFRKFEEVY